MMKLSAIAKAAMMLALGVISSVALARTDTMAVPFGESFETQPGGLWADGTKVAVTNGWYSGAADQSIVTNIGEYVFLPGVSGVTYPIAGDHNRVLKLNTEGTTLTNDVSNGSFATSKLYIDTMVNFVVSQDIPTAVSNDRNVKVATFLYENGTSTNLVIYHGAYDAVGGDFAAPRFTVTPTALAADTWYRLTVTCDSVGGDNPAEAFQVKVNGQTVESTAAYGDSWKTTFASQNPSAPGTWFLTAARSINGGLGDDPTEVTSIGFQGTGFIDDLLVTKDDVPPPEFVTITQVIGANGSASPAGSFQIAVGGSTSIVYTANDWYRIGSLMVNGVENLDAAGDASYTLDLANVQADVSNNVSFVQANSTQTGYPASIPTSWFVGLGLDEGFTPDTDDQSLEQEYLLNTDPSVDEDVTFKVDSISVAGSDVTVVVSLAVSGDPAPTAAIIGTLKLYGRDSLTTGDWTFINEAPLDALNQNDTATFSFSDANAAKFYKAVIE